MALYRFFKKEVPDVPSLYEPLSPATIKDVNVAVKQCADRGSEAAAKPRGPYVKFTPEDQAAITKYALWPGNKAAIRRFSFDHPARVDLASYPGVQKGGGLSLLPLERLDTRLAWIWTCQMGGGCGLNCLALRDCMRMPRNFS